MRDRCPVQLQQAAVARARGCRDTGQLPLATRLVHRRKSPPPDPGLGASDRGDSARFAIRSLNS